MKGHLLINPQDDVVSKPFRIPDLIPKVEQLSDLYSIKQL